MRLFLALALPGELCSEVETWIAGRLDLSGWRWVRPEGWHVTLRFLGWTDPALHRRALPAWANAVAGVSAFTVKLGQVGCFPPRGEPRVLWVALEELPPLGRMAEVASVLEAQARGLGFPPESRPFRPHLTLARRTAGGPDRPREPATLGRLQARVEEVVLYQSRIGREGARYTALDRFALGAL